MIDPLTLDRALYRLLYVALAGVFVFLSLLPLETRTGLLPGPAWMVCLTFAWIQRRPDYLPPWLIALVFLMLDLLLMRPPGLLSALVLIGSEFLRSRRQGSGESAFGAEWLITGATIVLVFLAQGTILALFDIPEGDFGRLTLQAVLTVIAYPVVVAASRAAFGVRPLGPGDPDRQGLSR